MRTNLFPATLLAGPPNCGKSVLAFLLTQHLREMGIQHLLLRAVPDGTPVRIISVARFESPKDHETLIDALARLGG